ncbi:hypothetical protein SAMN05421505_110167 [Sinosporangium album]|uniref:Uncharacterized protein n=1 Tax=Sinosporangium album TaxID=504805 RepID=A0A1G7Z328_9ACTN|nr:hypothetical protein [Sinosporangium album]SDH02989.1 hypothetical protein SAMN05421505_110167 [Sinosporangium album]
MFSLDSCLKFNLWCPAAAKGGHAVAFCSHASLIPVVAIMADGDGIEKRSAEMNVLNAAVEAGVFRAAPRGEVRR